MPSFRIFGNIIYEKFKNYDFANTEVIILNDLDILSEKMIVQLQKFLLNEGYIFVLMNENIIENNKLFYSSIFEHKYYICTIF